LPESDLRVLIEAARAAGDVARRFDGPSAKLWHKPDDAGPVTEADLAVNELLHQRLTQARPDYGWLSEETEDGATRLQTQRVFVIDPIDGTRAFLRGTPQFAVSAALIVDEHPVSGAVFNPAQKEMFEAIKGGGARLNGTSIEVSTSTDPTKARLLSSKETFRNHNWPEVAKGAEFHFVNSMAYRMAVVASGRFDATITTTKKCEWDIAAAHLIVEEAGGCVTNIDGTSITYNRERVHTDNVLCAGKKLHDALLAGLKG